MLMTLAVAAGAIYASLCIALFLGQDRLVFFPDRHLVASPADRGLPHSEHWITTADGVRVHAWYIPGPERAPVVLFLHGNAGNISHRLDTAALLSRLGAGVMLLSYRGYGLSGGSASESGTYRDAAAAHAYLTGTLGVPASRLVVFGRSLGGGVASWLASERACGALILESTFTSVPDLGAHVYPAFPVRLLARIRYDTRSRIARARCPVTIIHSRSDEVVPFTHGEALFREAAAQKRFVEIRGGHNEALMLRDPAYADYLEQLFAALRAPG